MRAVQPGQPLRVKCNGLPHFTCLFIYRKRSFPRRAAILLFIEVKIIHHYRTVEKNPSYPFTFLIYALLQRYRVHVFIVLRASVQLYILHDIKFTYLLFSFDV